MTTTDTAPDTAMPAEIASLVERLRHMGDYTRRYRLHVNYCKTANEAATALEAQAAELAAVKENCETVCNSYADENQRLYDRAERAEAALAEANKALDFYANPEHWRTANAGGPLNNTGYGLGFHRTDPDGQMDVLGANCGQWVQSKHMVHGGHWQADAGHVARRALAGGKVDG